MTNHRFVLRSLLVLLPLFTLLQIPTSALAQTEGGRLAFGFQGGASKYWGDFTDNQFWLSGDIFARWNISSLFSVQATGGLAQLRYKLTPEVLAGNPDYFGANAK